jgi:hypothetical protein
MYCIEMQAQLQLKQLNKTNIEGIWQLHSGYCTEPHV